MERTNWTTEIEYILRNLYEFQGTEKIPFCYLVSGIPGNPPGNSTLVILTFPEACLHMPLHHGYLVCILFCPLYADKLATIKKKNLSFTG